MFIALYSLENVLVHLEDQMECRVVPRNKKESRSQGSRSRGIALIKSDFRSKTLTLTCTDTEKLLIKLVAFAPTVVMANLCLLAGFHRVMAEFFIFGEMVLVASFCTQLYLLCTTFLTIGTGSILCQVRNRLWKVITSKVVNCKYSVSTLPNSPFYLVTLLQLFLC